MGTLEYAVLGPVEVRRDGHPVPLGPLGRRTTLAALLVDAGRVVATDVLVERVWDGHLPDKPLSSLHAHVSRLRTVLGCASTVDGGSPLQRTHPGYRLLAGPGAVDAVRFEAELTRARGLRAAGDVRGARDAVGQGLALWRDRAYADVPAGFAAAEADRLAGLRATARELAAELDLDLGRHAEIIDELEELVAADPLRENLWAALITALHRCGREADALRRYAAVRALIADELGTEPGAVLTDLHARLLRSVSPRPRSARPTPGSGQSPVRTRMVGRDDERHDVLRTLGRVWPHGGPAAVAVLGEAGIGKTRLIEDVTDAVPPGVLVARGRCWEHGGTPVLWPWSRVLRALVAELGPDAAAELAGDRAGALGAIAPGLFPAVPPSSPGSLALFDALAAFLGDVAARHPLLVVLEDVHWADRASVEMAEYLIGHARPAGVAVLVSVRRPDDDGPDAARPLLAALARDERSATVALSGLGPDEVTVQVRDRAGFELGPADAAALVERTGGNPFYVGELVRLVRDGGIPDVVPDSVRETVLRRVARLDEPARRTLDAAAVLGGSFDPGLLAAISGLDDDATDDAVDRATAAGFLRGDPAQLWFTHALVAQAVRDDVGPARRRRLHERCARALDTRADGDPQRDAERIVAHLVAAGGPEHRDEAVTRQLRLVDAAMNRGNFLAARDLVESAVTLAGTLSGPAAPEREMAALVRLSNLEDFEHGPLGHRDATARARALELARRLPGSGHRELAVALINTWGLADGVADWQAGMAAADELAIVAEAAGDRTAAAIAHAARAQVLMNQARLRETDEQFSASMRLSRGLDANDLSGVFSSPLELTVLWRAYVRTHLGEHDAAEEDLQAGLAEVRASDQPHVRVHSLGILCLVWATRDRPDVVEPMAAEHCERAHGMGVHATAYFIAVVLGWARVRLGRDGALDELRAAVAGIGEPPTLVLRPMLYAFAAEALLYAGQIDEARALLDRSIDEVATTGAALSLPQLHRLRARAMARSGDRRGSRDELARAVAVAREQGVPLAPEGRAMDSA